MNRESSPPIFCFAGPSLPARYRTDPAITYLPSAKRGDLSENLGNSKEPAIVVFADATFLQTPGPTHLELATVLNRGDSVIGCSSAGALRAFEMRPYGMIGVGSVFSAIGSQIFNDDSELFVLMTAGDEIPLTLPLINCRAALGAAGDLGFPASDLKGALQISQSIFWADRTVEVLVAEIARRYPLLAQKLQPLLLADTFNVKLQDCLAALNFAMNMLKGIEISPPTHTLNLFGSPRQ